MFLRFLLLSLLISLNSLAYDIQGRIEILEGSTTWVEGETRTVVFTAWPLEEIDEKEVEDQVLGKDFAGKFFVSKVSKIGFSENNPTAFQIEMNLTLKSYFPPRTPLIWSYRALNVPVDIGNIEIKQDPKKIQDFIVLNTGPVESLAGNYSKYIYALLGVVVSVLFMFLLVRLYKKKKNRDEFQRNVTYWRNEISKVEDRSGFESLYKDRDKWSTLFQLEDADIVTYFDLIEENQYKRDWDQETMCKLKDIHEKIKESTNA